MLKIKRLILLIVIVFLLKEIKNITIQKKIDPNTTNLNHSKTFVLNSQVPFDYVKSISMFTPLVTLLFVINSEKHNPESFYFLHFINYFLTINVSDILKKIVGRPRPDFFDRIKVNTELNTTKSKKEIEIAYQSFPSSHASVSFSNSYFIIYNLILCEVNKILIFFVFILLNTLSIYVCNTRYVDNKHSILDLVSGSLIGILSATFIFIFNFDIFFKKKIF